MYENSDTYILHKVIHDILDCLTSYNECVRIIQYTENRLHPNVLSTLSAWNNEVDNWRSEILSIMKNSEEHSETNTNWIMSLEKIYVVVEKSSDFKFAMQSLIHHNVSKWVAIAIRQSIKLESISQALKAHDYEKLKFTQHW